ncbi:MAG TPA: stage II sporulation protein M [Actinomycetes bacterium]|nr:stage II sporulation protein M [Actinomycetes bacterium]
MDIDRYIATNGPVWSRLAELTGRAQRGVGRLPAADLDELVRLYQRVAGHLSYAQTYYRDPALTAKLSGLVARAGAVVYGTRPRTLRALARFFTVSFPAAIWHVRWFVVAATLASLLPAAALGTWLASSPAAIQATAPAAVREAYVERDFEAYYSSAPAAEFASQVFSNNVQVAFEAFAVGILLCLGTLFVLVSNGANLGVAAGLFAAAGQQPKFWGLILPHGMLELTSVFVAGAAGLRLGWTLIDPGDRTRGAALAEEGRRAVVIVLGLVVTFLVAGTIEGFVTGRPWPTWLRVGIGVAAEAGFLAWVLVLGRRAAAQGLTGALGEQDAGGWLTDRERVAR